jgi:hypothetical protein
MAVPAVEDIPLRGQSKAPYLIYKAGHPYPQGGGMHNPNPSIFHTQANQVLIFPHALMQKRHADPI